MRQINSNIRRKEFHLDVQWLQAYMETNIVTYNNVVAQFWFQIINEWIRRWIVLRLKSKNRISEEKKTGAWRDPHVEPLAETTPWPRTHVTFPHESLVNVPFTLLAWFWMITCLLLLQIWGFYKQGYKCKGKEVIHLESTPLACRTPRSCSWIGSISYTLYPVPLSIWFMLTPTQKHRKLQ